MCGRKPQGRHPKIIKIIKFVLYSLEIPYPVTIAVGE